MKYIFSCVAIMIYSVSLIRMASAFTEPTGTPPTKNVPAPLNVGAGRQEKSGDLTVQNMKASSITLSESTRTSWLDAASACAWEGWKCDCRSDGSSFASIAVTIGAQCSGGQLRDIRIMDLQISSKGKTCPVKALVGCAASLYTYKNIISGGSGSSSDVWYNPLSWFY